MKDASDVIAPILTGLINKSFTDGVFPGVCKCAKVTALFKDGDKSLQTRSDFEKHLTIKNCDKTFLKIILRLKNC